MTAPAGVSIGTIVVVVHGQVGTRYVLPASAYDCRVDGGPDAGRVVAPIQ